MSSFANHPNNSASAPILESDNDDENESMMHKVKDVVSKFLHPSFLFSNTNDTNNPKRKRSISDDEQQSDTTNRRPIIRDDEPQLTDDEDSNSRDVPSIEIDQQKKRRRTANYQNILSTKTITTTHRDERIPSTSTDSVRSLSDTRSTHFEENPNERINRLTSSKQRFNIPSSYRGLTPNYDPTKSPLFSVGSRTTNLKSSNEFSANYLLATSLITRPQSSSSSPSILNSQSTLTNPITNHKNRLITNERQMLGVNTTRRLPYIERLRQRTLQDCIRLNRTVDSEPLSTSTIEAHQSPISKRKKVSEKECGIQCDITTTVDNSNKKIPSSEVLPVPIVEKTDSSIQTNSSITIEKIQPPRIEITKPKVLGDVTPFLWPKFARAQEEYAKKYPEKCQAATVPTKSVVDQSNINSIPAVSQRSTNSSTIPIFTSVSSRPEKSTPESIWKCPSCTKEHPAQTASCSLCHGINPNYKRLSAMEPTLPTATVEKEPVSKVSSSKLPDFIAKEPNVTSTDQPVPIVSPPVTTKENISSRPPSVTTSTPLTGRITFPVFGTTPFTSFPTITTKENPVTTSTSFSSTAAPLFNTTPILSVPTITKENPVTTNTPFMSTASPSFGTTPVITKESTVTINTPVTSTTPPLFGTTPTTTKENPVPTNNPFTSAGPPLFGVTPTTTKENPFPTNPPFISVGPPMFGLIPAVTKENPVTTSASFMSTTAPLFGSPTTVNKSLISSAGNFFQTAAPVPTFGLLPSTSVTTAVSSSTVPSITSMTPGTPPSSTSFGSIPTITITPATSASLSTISSDIPSSFTFATTTPTPSLITNPSTSSNLFSTSRITPTPVTTASFPVSSAASAFSISSSFTFTSPTTTSTSSPFGGSGLSAPGFNFAFGTTTTTPSNPTFGFGAISPLRPFTPTTISSTQTNPAPTFGSAAPFGVSSTSVPSFSPFGSSNAPSLFGFGNTSNTTTSTVPTSAAPPALTSGFSPPPNTNINTVQTSVAPPVFTSGFSPLPNTNINTVQTPVAPPVFTSGFSSPPNTNTNTVQTSVAPPLFTSGFSHPPSTSTIPVFGAGPAPLSSVGASTLFNFSAAPTIPTNNTSFQFTGSTSTPVANPFESPASSDSMSEHNPFDAGNDSSRTERRPPIRGIRRLRH